MGKGERDKLEVKRRGKSRGKGRKGREERWKKNWGKRWKGERHKYHSTDGIPAYRVGWKNNTQMSVKSVKWPQLAVGSCHGYRPHAAVVV